MDLQQLRRHVADARRDGDTKLPVPLDTLDQLIDAAERADALDGGDR